MQSEMLKRKNAQSFSRSASRKVARLSDDDDVDFDNDDGEDDAWTVMLVSYSERTKWPKWRKL